MPGNELIGKEELREVIKVFNESGGVLYAHGFEKRRNNIFRVRSAEKFAARRFKSKFCTAVSSGTAALYTALKSLNLKKGDEVITQAHTFVATVEAIVAVGATPIIVNACKCLNMKPRELENAITKKTKCIIPVHMLGNPANMNRITAIAKKYKIPIIEDACQSIGAQYRGKYVGTIGEFGTFSLDFGKNITAGEGGLVFNQKQKHYNFIKSFPDHGHINDPKLPRGNDRAYTSGFNFRMTEIQAAILTVQMKKLDFILNNLRKNKKIYKDILIEKLQNKVEFRRISDHKETGDTLAFFVPSKKIASKVVKGLRNNKVDIKIIPDAIKWHFSGYWSQIWKDQPKYKNSTKIWDPTKNILERCICLPINVLDKKNKIERNAEIVIKETLKNL